MKWFDLITAARDAIELLPASATSSSGTRPNILQQIAFSQSIKQNKYQRWPFARSICSTCCNCDASPRCAMNRNILQTTIFENTKQQLSIKDNPSDLSLKPAIATSFVVRGLPRTASADASLNRRAKWDNWQLIDYMFVRLPCTTITHTTKRKQKQNTQKIIFLIKIKIFSSLLPATRR